MRSPFPSALSAVFLALLLLFVTGCQSAPMPEASDPEEESSAPEQKAPVRVKKKADISFSPAEQDLILAQGGKAKVQIVMPKAPTEKVQKAAEDLQARLTRIIGDTVPLIDDSQNCTAGSFLFVGPTRQTLDAGIKQPAGYPGEERVLLKRAGNAAYLLGNDDGTYNGTQFAVTMFLEELGCGWFGMDELWQIVPEHPDLSIRQMDIDHLPQFDTRLSGVWFDWLGQHAISQRWYMGGNSAMMGHHIGDLIPPDTYFPLHPEWFALSGGQRCTGPNFQYCYSNKELAKEAAKNLAAYFDQNPLATNFAIGANDGWEVGWCECEACTALGNDTDEILTFANNVAACLEKTHPDKRLTVLAYHTTFFPPKQVKAHKNVEVMFCQETGMMVDLDKGELIHQGYHSTTHTTFTQPWKDNFREYIQKADLQNKAIWAWHCIAAENDAWKDIPWVQGNVATRNQALWKRNGVHYVFYDSGPASWHHEGETSFEVRWPLWYVAAKGMWDGSLTGEEILLDACEKLYGPAAGEMFAYYQALADSAEQCKSLSITWVPPMLFELYPDERIAVIDETIEKAKAKLGAVTEDQKKRMENQFQYWNKTKFILQLGTA